MNHKQIAVVWLYNGRCKRRLRKRYVWFQSFDEVERKKVNVKKDSQQILKVRKRKIKSLSQFVGSVPTQHREIFG